MNIRVHVLFLIMVAEFDTRRQLLLLYHRLIRRDNARAHGQWPRQKLQGIKTYLYNILYNTRSSNSQRASVCITYIMYLLAYTMCRFFFY